MKLSVIIPDWGSADVAVRVISALILHGFSGVCSVLCLVVQALSDAEPRVARGFHAVSLVNQGVIRVIRNGWNRWFWCTPDSVLSLR
jgi:hypothetical protein